MLGGGGEIQLMDKVFYVINLQSHKTTNVRAYSSKTVFVNTFIVSTRKITK